MPVFQTAVARGNLTQKVEGVSVSGEMLDLVNTINDMIDQLDIFASEVKKVAREVGTAGKRVYTRDSLPYTLDIAYLGLDT